jgi:hypothetical protein
MTYNKEQLLETLKNLPIHDNCNFGEENKDEVLLALENTIFNRSYNYEYGATKLAIIPSNEDFVIKIPFTGTYVPNYDDDYEENPGEWQDFWGAEDSDQPWNYCESEVNRYQIAEENGFAACFAETKLLGTIHGFPIYIQEKCEILEHCYKSHTHSKEECHYYSKNFSSMIDPNWLVDFGLYYGEGMLKDFLHFLELMGWDDDLRKSNIGYIKDRPVIVDYSGFWE